MQRAVIELCTCHRRADEKKTEVLSMIALGRCPDRLYESDTQTWQSKTRVITWCFYTAVLTWRQWLHAVSYPNLPDARPSSYDTKKIPNASGKRTKPLTKARKKPEHCVKVSRRGWWLWVVVGLWKQVVTTVTTKHAKDRRGSCRHHVRICKEHLWGCKQRQPLCPSTGLCGHC